MSIVSERDCSANAAAAPPAGRKLRLKARAERMAETHERIARAAYELHASVGPARTTISGIAERAGVQRLTVYKHFPHDRDIFQACTDYFLTLDPPPDPTAWGQVADPPRRLRRALDRKSTRLNSSHGYISYAVFCLKKKTKQQTKT